MVMCENCDKVGRKIPASETGFELDILPGSLVKQENDETWVCGPWNQRLSHDDAIVVAKQVGNNARMEINDDMTWNVWVLFSAPSEAS